MVIIGCGVKVLSSKKREFIDSSLVVRMNNFRIEGYEDFVGTRTDIYACSKKYLAYIDSTEAARQSWCEDWLKQSIVGHEEEISKWTEEEKQRRKKEWMSVHALPNVKSNSLKEILYVDAKDKSQVVGHPLYDKIRVCDFYMEHTYSTGFKTILYCLRNYADHQIFVTGFDNFMSSGWYWDAEQRVTDRFKRTNGYTDGHPYLIEKTKMMELLTTGTIVEI